MQGQSIPHTLPKLQTECEMYGSLGSVSIVIWGGDLSVRSSLHAVFY